MNVRICDTIEQLAEQRLAWDRLLAETPQANFFQSLPWLEAYWRHFGAGQKLRVLWISEKGETTGILPLVVRREVTKVGPVRFLTYPLDYWGSSYGPLGRDPQAVLAAGLARLHEIRRDWDVLELRWIGSTADECAGMCGSMRKAGFSPVTSLLDQTVVIQLDRTWPEYLANRSSKWRNNLKRWTRRLNEHGQLRYVRYRSEGQNSDPRWDLFDHCMEIARVSWQGSSLNGTTLSHAQIHSFIRDAHAAAAQVGAVDMNLLFVGQRPVAFAYNYTYQGCVFGLRIGYDASLKSAGPGNILYARTIEDSFQRGDWRYDLGIGSLEAKENICTQVLPVYRLSCFQPLSLRQQLLRWKRTRDTNHLLQKI